MAFPPIEPFVISGDRTSPVFRQNSAEPIRLDRPWRLGNVCGYR